MRLQEQLAEQSYAEVEFAGTAIDTQAAFDGFDALLTLPRDYRTAGDYSIGEISTGSFGYFRRVEGSDMDGRRNAADTKHVYHFGSNSRQAFETYGWRKLPTEVRQFCEGAEAIYWLGVACLRETLTDLHEEFSFKDQRTSSVLVPDFLDPKVLLNIHLRMSAYELPKTPEEPIAKGHFDRSVFTLALAETEPGLQIGRLEDGSDLVDITHCEGKAKFFAGAGWDRMPTELREAYDFIKPAYHQVINTGNYSAIGGPIVRRAMVLFANSLNHNTDPTNDETRPKQLVAVA